ncbi:TipJ family phage tail tip protein [Providencia sp. PROV019]|uniref:TipJ family phage tail tip protein n=1 Tax=Providencia sp. PROV019 TaxID=2949754 RepID=UPI00234AB5D8
MGKGGGKQHTPYEAPNDLTSRQKLSIIDLVSEGPIEGPVGDLKGVYLNNTPVIDSSGNSNVNGMTAQWVAGTLEQPALEGFSSSSSETPVSIEIKKSTPVTRTITSRNIDRLRLTFGTQALVEVKDNGDRVGTSVELQVQVQRNGAWVTEKNITIRGKRSNSPYLMAVIIDKLPPPPFSIRMVRLTPDSNSDKLQNNTIWSSYTEITDINQTYPGSAVAGLTFESEQFGNQYPTRNYLVRGLIVQVPNNYNPETRVYSGIWDGTFKPAYTNNPAWVLYSLLTTKRFGLGKRLKIAEVDKFALYVIGQYCDQLVPDGFGNKEPRVTCNAYITDIRKAYDYFSDLCSIMRIMPVWNGLQMTFVQDRPSDVVWPYTNANVVNGRFHYSFSPLKARHTVIEVRFIDPQNGWKTSVEQVSDDALVAQFGLNVLRVDAFGCTSRGQARRYGLWILLTEKLETQTVEFEVGAEGLRHTPGDIIEIMDNDWVGGEDPIGGRLIAIDTTQKILTLDREVTKPKSGTAFISLMNATGRYERVKVTGYLGNNQIKVESVPKGVATKSVWGISQPDLARRLFRAITISDKGDGTYGVIAVQHVPEKEAIVDQGVKFEPLPDTPLGGYIPPVENLSVEVSADSDSWQVEANWTTATAVRGVDFILKLTQAGRIVGTAKTQENRYRIGNLPQGNYLLSVAPQNKDGQKGEQASVSFDINPPPPPSYIDVEPGFFSLGIIPHVGGQNALRLQYEFWFSEKQIANINEVELLAEYLGNGTMWVIQGRKLKAGQTYYVYVRTVNPVGKSQFVEANGKPEDRADEILEVIGDKFLSTEAGQQMQEQIDFNKDNLTDLKIDSDDFRQKVISIDRELGAVNEAVMTVTQMSTENYWELKEESAKGKASIKQLQQVQADFTTSQAKYQQEVAAQFEHTAADVLNVQNALAKSNEAFAEDIRQVRADLGETNEEVGTIKGRVTDIATATTDLEKAQAKHEASVVAEFGEMRGYLTHLGQVTTDDNKALVEAIGQTQAQFLSLHNESLVSRARIIRTETALATETEARAEDKVQIDARFNDAEGAITTIKEVQAQQGEAIAKSEEQLRAEINLGDEALQGQLTEQGRELSEVSSVATEHKSAIADLDKTVTQVKQTQQSQYNETKASINELSETATSLDEAMTTEKALTESRFEETEASISSLQQTVANIEGATVEAVGQLQVQHDIQGIEVLSVKASIRRVETVIATETHALAQKVEQLDAQYGAMNSNINSLQKVVADNQKSQAEVNELIKSEVGDNKAAIELRGQTIFDHKGNGSAIYTIKTGINWNGQYYDAKFLMGATVQNGKVVTQIGFSADTFGILNPSSGKLEPVFFVENGQVFINEAFINKATIEKIIVGTDMRSKNYAAGKTGTRIDMNNGTIEINGSDGSGSRMTIKNDQIAVYAGGKPKIVIGRLYGI